MTGTQIKTQAAPMMRWTMDDAAALIGINSGILKMGDIVDDEVASAAYVSGTWYSLPSACISVTEVNIDNDKNTSYTGWRTSANGQEIIFNDDGTYIIHYSRNPQTLTALTGTPEMHVSYHDCLVTYLIGWYKYKKAIDNDEKQEGSLFMNTQFPMELAKTRRKLRRRVIQMIASRDYRS
jgi:hypothetical protein